MSTISKELDKLKNKYSARIKSKIVSILNRNEIDSESLYRLAARICHRHLGDEVHLRGIIEFSNYCGQNCFYCGIRADNHTVKRYKIPLEQVYKLSLQAREYGYRTVVLQSGEPAPYSPDSICRLITRIKQTTDLAITLSCGVYPAAVYRQFADAGCDRYLLRFESSDQKLFNSLHPDITLEERLQALLDIRAAGLQTGSGFLIGLPGSSPSTLADDILLTSALSLDMIGCGPFLRAPQTPLSGRPSLLLNKSTYYNTLAILRILNPLAHIPATTAFDAIDPHGRDLVLQRGGNVFMPNLTPKSYRKDYQLYPGKPCVDEKASQCAGCVRRRLARLNRPIAENPGGSFRLRHIL